jgi:hypothetical protein
MEANWAEADSDRACSSATASSCRPLSSAAGLRPTLREGEATAGVEVGSAGP